MSADVTVVILTLNEEKTLPRCLNAIPASYKRLVVDSGSTDNTIAVARDLGCEVVRNDWGGYVEQRNFALNGCGVTSKWALFVDADEVFLPEFFEWLESDSLTSAKFDVGYVSSLIVFDGVVLKHAPGYPIYHHRLFRVGAAEFIHNHAGYGETVDASAKVEKIDIPYLHYWYEGNAMELINNHVRYASMEKSITRPKAEKLSIRSCLSVIVGNSPLRAFLRFIYHYVVRCGFLDGRAGLRYSIFYSWYEFTKLTMNLLISTRAAAA